MIFESRTIEHNDEQDITTITLEDEKRKYVVNSFNKMNFFLCD